METDGEKKPCCFASSRLWTWFGVSGGSVKFNREILDMSEPLKGCDELSTHRWLTGNYIHGGGDPREPGTKVQNKGNVGELAATLHAFPSLYSNQLTEGGSRRNLTFLSTTFAQVIGR